jgi:surface antigen
MGGPANTYRCAALAPNAYCAYTPTYPARQCTSYVADLGSRVLGTTFPTGWGDALNWPARARAVGWRVDTQYTVGSIFCLGANQQGASPKGHVAWIEALSPGMVTVSEYDWIPYNYDVRAFLTTGAQCIHLPVVPPPVPPLEDPDVPVIEVFPDDIAHVIPAFTVSNSLNLVAMESCAVTLFIWKPDGTAPASRVITLAGNQPGVQGPAQVSGYIYQLLGVAATYGPCTLSLGPSTAPYTATIH